MHKVHGNDCLAHSTVHRWFKRFKTEGSKRAELTKISLLEFWINNLIHLLIH